MTEPTADPLAPSMADDVGPRKLPLAPRFERIAIAAAVGLQLVLLVGMILGKTVPYLGARTVLLRVVPVDPRDFFRGDYVILSYDFTRLGSDFNPGETVYVPLVPDADGRHYHHGPISRNPPAAGLYIQGVAGSSWRATYGIESYYVQEKTGHDYEAAARSGTLWAEVALDAAGRARVKGLVIE